MADWQANIISPEQSGCTAYRCQYLIIGTGAGGSVAGTTLAEQGYDVLFLEEGNYFPAEAYTPDISDMTAQLYRNRGISPFYGLPSIGFVEGCCVGGGTVINGGLIWRTPSWILEEWVEKYGLHEYNEEVMKPYFETVERDLHVVRREPEIDVNLDSMAVRKGAERLGWKHVMIPHAVKNCTNLNLCPTGCPTGAKQSMLETYLPRALNHGARILTSSRAVHITRKGKCAHSVYAKIKGHRKPICIHFDHLILAGGAVQTPHLLRRSRLSARAGRTLQFHLNIKIVAKFHQEVHARRGAMFTVQVQEYERQGMLFMGSNLQPHYIAMTLAQYGPEVIDQLLEAYNHLGLFVAMIKPKSLAHIMSWTGDKPLVWYRFHSDDLGQIKQAITRACILLFESGAKTLFLPVRDVVPITSIDQIKPAMDALTPMAIELITVHAMASCPMGNDPGKSVVNPEGRLWDMDNVFVMDASFLPSNIGESPQGTIMAFVHNAIQKHLF